MGDEEVVSRRGKQARNSGMKTRLYQPTRDIGVTGKLLGVLSILFLVLGIPFLHSGYNQLSSGLVLPSLYAWVEGKKEPGERRSEGQNQMEATL